MKSCTQKGAPLIRIRSQLCKRSLKLAAQSFPSEANGPNTFKEKKTCKQLQDAKSREERSAEKGQVLSPNDVRSAFHRATKEIEA